MEALQARLFIRMRAILGVVFIVIGASSLYPQSIPLIFSLPMIFLGILIIARIPFGLETEIDKEVREISERIKKLEEVL